MIIKTQSEQLPGGTIKNGHIISFRELQDIRPENCPTFSKTNIYVDFSLSLFMIQHFENSEKKELL